MTFVASRVSLSLTLWNASGSFVNVVDDVDDDRELLFYSLLHHNNPFFLNFLFSFWKKERVKKCTLSAAKINEVNFVIKVGETVKDDRSHPFSPCQKSMNSPIWFSLVTLTHGRIMLFNYIIFRFKRLGYSPSFLACWQVLRSYLTRIKKNSDITLKQSHCMTLSSKWKVTLNSNSLSAHFWFPFKIVSREEEEKNWEKTGKQVLREDDQEPKKI